MNWLEPYIYNIIGPDEFNCKINAATYREEVHSTTQKRMVAQLCTLDIGIAVFFLT